MQIQDIANSNILHANSNMNPTSQRQLASEMLLSNCDKISTTYTTPKNPKKMGLKLHET